MAAAMNADNGSAKSGKSSKWYSRLLGKAKVCNSEDVPNQVVEQQPKKKLPKANKAKKPPLVVNYFPSGPGLSRL
ncbi:unnamed protein product [Calypogeia fissa]